MKLIAATNNMHKLQEIRAILASEDVEVLSMQDIGLHMDIQETGTTFEENAMLKARAVHEASGFPALADDSGLEVDALNGAPGIYSARYAGESATDLERIEKVWKNLEHVDDTNLGAQFVSAVACVLSETTSFVVRGICRGVILRECRGTGGFGYDPCFYVPELGKTYAELTAEEKNQISHRKHALDQFLKEFQEKISQRKV